MRGTVATLPLVITSPGTYTLDRDYTNLGGAVAIDVRASNVIIDGAGHTLDGTDAANSVGVQAHGSAALSGVIVRNLRLTDWSKGIYYWNARGSIESVTASSNTGAGIMLYSGGDGTIITGCTAENNGVGGLSISYAPGVDISSCTVRNNGDDGIYIYASNDARITGVTSSGNTLSGIALLGASSARINGVLVSGCQVTGNGKAGIYMSRAEANTVVNNRIENTVNTMLEGTEIGANTWNTAKTAGTNIVGGPYLGGNWWSGFSESATDANRDGIADLLYTISSGNSDALPLAPPPPTGSEIYAGMVITAPGTYSLNTDIYDSDHTVVVEVRCSNVVIDGKGHRISGSSTAGWAGIFVSNPAGSATGVTIRDLTVSNCYYGIYFLNADAGRIERCRIADTPSNGMGLILSQGSDSNIVTGNGVFSGYNAGPGTYGIAIVSSSQNTITNNEFNNPANVALSGAGSNTWNSAKTAGENIMGGPYLGGNYWAEPDGTGWSEQVADANHDGIGDSSYAVGSGNADSLPLVLYEPAYTVIQPYWYRINQAPGNSREARIDGDNIVWRDWRAEPNYGYSINSVSNLTPLPRYDEDYRDSDIYLYNLVTGRETPICVDPGIQDSPDVSGNRVVWSDRRNGYRDLYYYDLATGQEHPFCTAPLGQYYPYIKGNRVVWLDYRNNGGTDAYLFDFSTGQERWIAATESTSVVDGDRVLYKTVLECPKTGLFQYSIGTLQKTQLTSDENSYGGFDLSGDYAVYTRTGTHGTTLVLHNLVTGVTKTIDPSMDGYYESLVIDGDRVFWQEYVGDHVKTRLYQISTNAYSEFDSPDFQLSDASGMRMVGSDSTGIGLYSLTPLPVWKPTADFTATPTMGTAPSSVQFTDTSTGSPTSWSWTFGDGSTSTLRNPSHTYGAGTYTVALTVWNAAGQSDTEIKSDLITAIPPPTITSVTPNTGTQGSTIAVTNLAGTGFQSGATVKLRRTGYLDIVGTSVGVVSSTKITCQFTLPSTVATGTWNVVVTNPSGQSGTLTNGFTVSSAPISPTLLTGAFQIPNVGGTVSVPIVLSSASGGISGYRITVSLSDPSVGTITAVAFPDWAGLKSSSALPAGQVVLQAVDMSQQVPIGAMNVILATLTVKGTATGSSGIVITPDPSMGIQNRNGDLYPITVQPGTLTVQSLPPVPGCSNPPADVNGDGRFEDVNGNGRADFADIVLYFNQMTWIAANEPVAAFDFNANGRIDFSDIVWLFNHV
ncbi:MAG TPA: PKD domain-containing protein [Methanoregulaceae archaeon]|nr:PKD domain-containing protein [Methanoregulaceae archaeon]